MGTSGVLTSYGKDTLYTNLTSKLREKYLGRFEVETGFVRSEDLDIMDRVHQLEWELALNSRQTVDLDWMPPVPSVWLPSFALEDEQSLERCLSVLMKTGTPPGVVRVVGDHEYVEAKRIADGEEFLLTCDFFAPMDETTQLVVTQCKHDGLSLHATCWSDNCEMTTLMK